MRLHVSVFVASSTTWTATVREADAVGFDGIVLADHLVDGLYPPLTALAVAADVSERLTLGTLVLAVDFRHPAILVREVAMLAEHSGGRFELGIGAGHMKSEWDAVGLRFDRAGVRIDRLAEAVTILRRLLHGETVTFEGEHYRLTEHRCWPVPAVPVPILVGGNGDRVLRLAAEQADIVGFTGFAPTADGSGVRLTHLTAAGLDERIAWVRAAAAAAGRDPGALRFQVLVQASDVTSDRRAAAAPIADRMAVPIDDVLDSPFFLLGTADQLAEQLRERTDRFGVDTWTVFAERPGITDQTMRTLGPVIERLRS